MIYFLIPAYNEEQNLPRLLSETNTTMTEIGRDYAFIFVDDGSTDNTPAILSAAMADHENIKVITHSPNQGVKAAFMHGFEAFLEAAGPGDILVTKECDNTSDNSILVNMLEKIESQAADVALASCYARGGGIEGTTFYRLFLSEGANLLIKFRFGMWSYSTFSSFYRAFSYDCLKTAFESCPHIMSQSGFACVVEMLLKLKRLGFRIVEVPMILRSAERIGESRMPIMKTIAAYLHLMIKGLGQIPEKQ